MQSFITLKSGRFKGCQVSLQMCSVTLERQQRWPSAQWVGKGKCCTCLQKRRKNTAWTIRGQSAVLWSMGEIVEQIILQYNFRPRREGVVWKCIFASLKFLLYQLSCNKFPVLLHPGIYYIKVLHAVWIHYWSRS